ncbi:MAG: DUF4979 domain-containing protein [Niastella sp.]|uniref:DUF4979 domain-containing protein n=1 Tax=Niastella sp. TaxID=1869183 RepID=UPI003899C4D9
MTISVKSNVLLLKQKWLRTAAMKIRTTSLLVLALVAQHSRAQTGLLNDDFSTGNTNNWKAATSGSTGQIVNGRFVVTMAAQAGGKYRGDFQKAGGVTLNAGAYPVVAIKFNKPPRCNYFFDTNLGSYNGTNNNATKIASATGNVYYWDLSKGTLGTTALASNTTTNLTSFQFKIADVVLTSAEVAANDIQYEVDWVKTFASVDELRAYVGVNNPPSFSFQGSFVHPGLLHNSADLARMKGFVANKFGRPYASYQLLAASTRSSATYQLAGPYQYLTRDATITVNGVNGGAVKNGVEADFLAAYYNALLYNITGDEAHAKKAVEIIDAYSATTIGIIGTDAALNGLYGCMLANAAELMRYTYPAWPVEKQVQCETMLKQVFYPVLQNFSPCSHGNWDIICMKALMAIAIYSNDTDMFNRVVTYFYHGEGNGSIDNYVLTAAGQLQESNRDQPHVMLALGSLAELSEMGSKQGVDLYSASGNAIMRGYEYTAKYNLGNTVDYQTAYDYCEKNYSDYTPEAISANGRGQWRPVFEIAYNHYVVGKGLQMPWTLQVMKAMGPEGTPAGADNPGYGSLFFYLNTAPDYPKDSTTAPVDTTIGLINDNFTSTADGWAAVTSGSVATVQNGKLNITLVTQSNGKGRGDVKKTAGATLLPDNYPIFAIRFKKPQAGNITFDTNLGSFGNGANKWTGKVGDDIYYYDLTKGGFGPTPTMLAKDKATKLTTFQFKVADISSGETSYAIEWVKTVRSLEDLKNTLPHVPQSISFDSIPAVLLGDTAAIVLQATASSNLPVSYTISDSTIATINNGVVTIIRDGTVTITASQSGDSAYLPALSVARTLTIAPLGIAVQSQDGDNGKPTNNSIVPYLKLVSQGNATVAYGELTARYWFTAENFAGINTWIDYAALGSSKVKMKYVALDTPRAGAYGYIEYSFDKTAGNLVAGDNSGVIQSRFANTDWSNFNEADDYSYANNKAYANNSNITLYRNGQLVWGVEPVAVKPAVNVKAYSATQYGNANTISTFVTINNEGNMPVAYGDLSVRYWFTTDGAAALNSWVDYAKLGNSNVITSFNTVSPVLTGADKYLEIKIDPTLGNLYPAGNTGNIQYRMAKSDWSNFTFANDWSYIAPAPLAENDHITVYYKGQLIYGTEPTAVQQARVAANITGEVVDNINTAASKIILFPNPATDHLNIQAGTVAADAVVQIYSLRGELLLSRRLTAGTQTISLQSLSAGIYQVEVRNGKTITTKQIIKH